LRGGVGVGWRPEIAGVIGGLPGLRFCEVIAESLGSAPVVPSRGVAELRGRGVAVVPHGVRLSLGGAEPLDPRRVTHLAACAAAVDAPLVSEHVAYVRAGGREAGHLLPVPRSRDALDVLTAHVTTVQAELDVPLALDDGWRLARTLHGRGELGTGAAVELAEREVTLRRTAAGEHVRRRLPAVRRAGRGVVVQLAGRVRHLPRS
jgi:uncharacterized protein (UPF0276 family)